MKMGEAVIKFAAGMQVLFCVLHRLLMHEHVVHYLFAAKHSGKGKQRQH